MNKLHPIISTKELSIGYRTKKESKVIQSHINLQIEKGQLIAVLGRNGIGKSTLLRTLTKVQNPLQGKVYIHQQDMEQIAPAEFSTRVSVVLTESLPDSQLTVFELVALGRQPYTNWVGKLTEKDLEHIRWSLEQTDTLQFAKKHFYELSDGQLQRVMIARALAQDTEIIVLDEPTAHLDMHHTLRIFQLLEKLVKESKKTILLSSHQVNLAIQYADQIVMMTKDGVISGSKESHIEKNHFEKLFPSDTLSFDANIEQFVIHKNPKK